MAITGDFVFQRQTLAGGGTLTVLGLNDAALTIDGQGITGASGAFVIQPDLDGAGTGVAGIAGVLSGRAAAAVGGVSLSGDLLVRVNTTLGPVDVTVEVGGRSIPIRFGAAEGDVLSVSASNLSLNIGDFVTIEGDVAFDGDTFAGQNLEIFLGQGPARLENGDLNPLAVGVLLTNARVGLIRIGSTYALHAEGTVMLLGVNGVTLVGTAVVDVNTTGTVIQRTLTIPGSTAAPVVVSFATSARVTRFQALDAELSVLGQTLRGNFAFDRDATTGTISIAASGVDLALGGAGTGVRIDDAGGAILVTPTGIAADLAGTVGLTVPGVRFDGAFRLAINTTTVDVDTVLAVGGATVALQLPAGPYLRVEGNGITMTIGTGAASQTLTGNFAFERITAPTGAVVTTIAASDVALVIRAGGEPIASLTDGSGLFVVDATGVGGRLAGNVTVTVPGGAVTISGSFTVEVNTTNHRVQASVVVGGQVVELDLARGAALRVVGTGVTLNILGQTLTADVSFEQITTAAGTRAVRIGIANLALSLGGGLVTVSNGTGALFITSGGTGQSTLAARLAGDVAVNVPGVRFEGTLGLAINTGAADINQTFMVGTTPVTLSVPGGRFLEISGTGVVLEVAGQRIAGSFAVRQTTDATGARTLRINVSDGTLTLGGATPVVSVTGVNGDLLVTAAGVAGRLAASVAVTLPGVSLTGAFQVELNTTLTAQTVGAATLPGGPYLRVAGTGALTVAGQTLSGSFTFEKVTRADGTAVVRVAAAGITLSVGGVVNVTGGAGFFVITPNGVAGSLAATVGLAVPGVSFSGSFTVAINNTALAVDETIQVGAGTARLQLPAGPYVRIEGTGINLTIAGQSLSGNVVFERFTRADGTTFVRIGLTGVRLAIGDGTNDVLTVIDGAGSLVIGSSGIAGSFSGTAALAVPGVTLGATVRVDVNRTGQRVDETFVVAGQTVRLALAAGNYVRVVATGVELGIAGLRLRGNFTFEQGGTAPNSYLRISMSAVELGIGDPGAELVRVTIATGELQVRSGAVFGAFTGTVNIDIPGVELEGAFDVELNTSLVAQTTAGSRRHHRRPDPVDLGHRHRPDRRRHRADGRRAVHRQGPRPRRRPDDRRLGRRRDDRSDRHHRRQRRAARHLRRCRRPPDRRRAWPERHHDRPRRHRADRRRADPGDQHDAHRPDAGHGDAAGRPVRARRRHRRRAGHRQRRVRDRRRPVLPAVHERRRRPGDDRRRRQPRGRLRWRSHDRGRHGRLRVPARRSARRRQRRPRRLRLRAGPGHRARRGGQRRRVAAHQPLRPRRERDDRARRRDPRHRVRRRHRRAGDRRHRRQHRDRRLRLRLRLLRHARRHRQRVGHAVRRPGPVRVRRRLDQPGRPRRADRGRDVLLRPHEPGRHHDGRPAGPCACSASPASSSRAVSPSRSTPPPASAASSSARRRRRRGSRSPGSASEGQFIVTQDGATLTIELDAVTLSLGDGAVVVTITTGDIVLGPAGVVAVVQGTIALSVPGVPASDLSLDAAVDVRINSTTTVQSIGGFTVTPGISVRATNATLALFGQSLSGDFAFEQVSLPLSPQAPPGSVAQKIVRIVASDVELRIAAGSDDIVTLTDGSGFFLLPATGGIAGRVGGTIEIAIPGLDASQFGVIGTFEVVVNSTTSAVSEEFVLDGQTLFLDVPAGPFLRVVGTGVQLRLLGQRLSGNFGFEQATAEDGVTKVVRIAASDVTLALGDGTTDYVRLTDGEAFLVIVPADGTLAGGVAGRISGTLELSLPAPVGLTGSFELVVNTSAPGHRRDLRPR